MKNFKNIIALFCILLISAVSFAQPGFTEDVDDVAPIPGLFIAAAAGLAIGIRKMYTNKNR